MKTQANTWQFARNPGRYPWVRLPLLVLTLALVLLMIRLSRRPENWHWLWASSAAPGSAGSTAAVDRFGGAGGWVAMGNGDAAPAVVTIGSSQTAAGGDRGAPLLAGLKPRELASIQDDTVFRPAERDAWFHIFAVLKTHDEAWLARFASEPVGFAQLFAQPDHYRGRLVTVRGQARRVLYRQAPANDVGVRGYWQVAVRPAGGPAMPLIIYCLHVPSGFPTGETIREDVTVHGVFFKNWAYTTGSQIHSFPTLLARTLVWSGAAPEAAGTAGESPAVVAAGRADSRPVPSDHRSAATGASPAADQSGTGGNPPDAPPPPNLFTWLGRDPDRLSQLADDRPLAEDDPRLVLKLLYDVRRLNAALTARWAQPHVPWAALMRDPAAYRGKIFKLTGRLVRVARQELSSRLIDRFDMDAYYRCTIETDNRAHTAIVLTPRVPRAWAAGAPVGTRVGASAAFVKRIAQEPGGRQPVFVARRLAWYPDKMDVARDVGLGWTVLGDLGVDVGLRDNLENRKPLTGRDRDAFFSILAAVDRIGTRQLVRLAERNLATLVPQWRAREKELARRRRALQRQAPSPDGQRPSGPDRGRQSDPRHPRPAPAQAELARIDRQLAQLNSQLEQARRGTFSVVPLFNEPARHFGQLVVLDGTARRAVKIYVGATGGERPMPDVWQRFRIESYYEIEMFTEDSENNPVTCCVRYLPEGFPTGAEIRVPIRIAGFFFKSWAYPIPSRAGVGGTATARAGRRWQLAPLVIGREPIRSEPATVARSPTLGLAVGGLFVFVLLIIWYGLWRWDRGDRRFTGAARAALEKLTFTPDADPHETVHGMGKSRQEAGASSGFEVWSAAPAERPRDEPDPNA